jgi:glycosyltransferase involved in cell wall biosynthesis
VGRLVQQGVLIPKENPKILANSVNRVLENPELRNQFIKNTCKKVQNRYSIEKYAHNMFNLYSKMMSDNL